MLHGKHLQYVKQNKHKKNWTCLRFQIFNLKLLEYFYWSKSLTINAAVIQKLSVYLSKAAIYEWSGTFVN